MQNSRLVWGFLLMFCVCWNYSFIQNSNEQGNFKQIQEACGNVMPDSITSVVNSEERLNQCVDMVEEFLKSSPHVAEAHLLLAELCYYKAIRYASDEQERRRLMNLAREEAQRAVELAPHNIRSLEFFAFILPEERGDEAVSALKKIINLHPSHYEAYWSLGMRAVKAGRIEDGMKVLRRAMELMTVPEILNERWSNLVGVLSEKGRYKEAIEISEVVLGKKLGEHDFSRRLRQKIELEVMWLRGVLLAEQDQTLDQGIQLMKEAIAQMENPDFSMGKRRGLADLLRTKGRDREALMWYETLLPSQEVEKTIEDLKKRMEQPKQPH
jgi:Tfp pilus assembly protein PilF